VPQHVVQRGNDRQACFFAADDYEAYRVALREASLKYGVGRTHLIWRGFVQDAQVQRLEGRFR
jgi:REP element-mobilizing transposase RayT